MRRILCQDYESSDWAVSDLEDELVRLKEDEGTATLRYTAGEPQLSADGPNRRPTDIFNLLQLVQCNWSMSSIATFWVSTNCLPFYRSYYPTNVFLVAGTRIRISLSTIDKIIGPYKFQYGFRIFNSIYASLIRIWIHFEID